VRFDHCCYKRLGLRFEIVGWAKRSVPILQTKTQMGTPDRRHDRSGPSRAGFAHPTADLFLLALCRRDAGYPAPPAQSRTCSFPASGSSVVLAYQADLHRFPLQGQLLLPYSEAGSRCFDPTCPARVSCMGKTWDRKVSVVWSRFPSSLIRRLVRLFSIASVSHYIPHEFPPRTRRFSHRSKFRLLCNLS
jgi:hypothetical protein